MRSGVPLHSYGTVPTALKSDHAYTMRGDHARPKEHRHVSVYGAHYPVFRVQRHRGGGCAPRSAVLRTVVFSMPWRTAGAGLSRREGAELSGTCSEAFDDPAFADGVAANDTALDDAEDQTQICGSQ